RYNISIPLTSHVSPRYLHSLPTRRSSDLKYAAPIEPAVTLSPIRQHRAHRAHRESLNSPTRQFTNSPIHQSCVFSPYDLLGDGLDRKSTRLNSSHGSISYAVFCLKQKTKI